MIVTAIVNHRNIVSAQPFTPIKTSALFPSPPADSDLSPIDKFLANTDAINLIYLNASGPIGPELGALVVLGYMSAVESFFRTLIRNLVHVDAYTRAKVEPMTVTYGAAMHHKKQLLPEALLEGMSFSGKKNIEDTLRDVIGLKGKLPNDVEVSLSEFGKICEVRHCCVHRFGKLGASNAIRLGLDEHSGAIEATFSPTRSDLQEIADVLRTFVKTVNNYVFYSILDRSARLGVYAESAPLIDWKMTYPQDRKRFVGYYDVFSTKSDASPSADAKSVYDSFRRAVLDGRQRRGGRARQ
ncbi:hypothetical protein [Devosia sp.]|uniref:hypothetical protein n=1 Tax=Devosia sp. TaxID=1871048 RepID=UPI003F6FA187